MFAKLRGQQNSVKQIPLIKTPAAFQIALLSARVIENDDSGPGPGSSFHKALRPRFLPEVIAPRE